MGLPVIHKRRGQSQHDYEVYCRNALKQIDPKDYDGYVNENSKDILFKLKDYIEVSSSYVTVLCSLSRSMDDTTFVWNIDPYYQNIHADYDKPYIIHIAQRNINRMIKSLQGQRTVAFCYKNIVRKNALTTQWASIFNNNIKELYERLNTIMRLVRENLESTPYILYLAYLEKHGISIMDDMKAALGDEYLRFIYAKQYDKADEIAFNHISDIFKIAMNDSDLIHECVANAKQYNEAIKRRTEQRKKEREEMAEAIFDSRRNEAVEILNSVCARADSVYKSSIKNEKARSLQYQYAGCKPFYIIASINTRMFSEPSNRHRYIPQVFYSSSSKTDRLYRTSNILHAKKFGSFEEAKTYENEIKALNPGLETTICMVDLAWRTAS